MEEQNGFPKYQYSVFDKNQGQFVVRSNDLEEFKELIRQALTLKKASDTSVTPQNDVLAAHNESETVFCAIHGTKLESKIGKSGKPYMGHYQAGEGMCFGRKK